MAAASSTRQLSSTEERLAKLAGGFQLGAPLNASTRAMIAATLAQRRKSRKEQAKLLLVSRSGSGCSALPAHLVACLATCQHSQIPAAWLLRRLPECLLGCQHSRLLNLPACLPANGMGFRAL